MRENQPRQKPDVRLKHQSRQKQAVTSMLHPLSARGRYKIVTDGAIPENSALPTACLYTGRI